MTRDISSVLPLINTIGPYNEVPEEYNSQDSITTLTTSKILVIGAGGLGCEILKNLALTGFKDIHVIDMDTIDLSNLNRQFLFRSQDIGKSKAETAAKFVMERIDDPDLKITPYFGKIQDKPAEYYRQFQIVISGLDSIEARRWINATLISLVDDETLIPLIDGGTEGFRGQSRVIIPTITSCFECSLDLLSPKVTYPVCTIANTPRLPEHCIEWASQLQWTKTFPNKKFDADDPEQVEWMYQTALNRAKEFDICGVTKSLTLGVVKNIIPAIASTNAIIAASCCNEAFKFVTSTNPILNNYMMYSGDDSIFTYTYSYTKKPNCPVCGNLAKYIQAQNWWTLQQFIEEISNKQEIQMTRPSLTAADKYLYLTSPPELEKLTKGNLSKKLQDLISSGEEIVITDPNLPISMRLIVQLSGSSFDPEFN
ncbi:uba3 [[Candida] subhashii]|uniref:NEDD8-activating enzyme E1 catalytic subunit n=1 Tax=[Candida] subhashii TaxID=561895 RepID=A0A8J5QI20_9ASCO|nr:uba3 [[Candida] subhashii]KAG7662458.1 uba3 [[Candida] subhashii]